MADTKISALTELAEAPADDDEFVVVDKSDTTMAASGTDKRGTSANVLSGHTGDTADAHDASAISIADSGGYFTGTDVETALQELGAGGGGSVAADAIFDAAGDLAVGTGSDTAAKLSKGSAGQVLRSGASTLEWGWPTILPVVPGTGDFIGPPPGVTYSTGAASGSAATASGRAIFTPLIVRRACSIASIRAEVSTIGDASSVIRLGLWLSDANGLPGTLIGQGTAAADSTGGKTVALSAALAGGLYWAASVWQGGIPTTAPVMRTNRSPVVGYDEATGSSPNLVDYYLDGVSGTFASNPSVTATSHGTTTGTPPAIYLEVA